MSSPYQAIIVGTTVLLVAVVPLLVSAINGYSYWTSSIIVSGWAKATVDNYSPSNGQQPSGSTSFYIGLRAVTWAYTVGGNTYVTSAYISDGKLSYCCSTVFNLKKYFFIFQEPVWMREILLLRYSSQL